ncbi:MAG: alpha/beta hydrolase [Alphaproteobacteria bacterium]|nr:alpha/beta hydrolase [Alphaproteobacteria bacterium]
MTQYDFARVDGNRLRYRRIAGGDPTIVFLHEGLGSIPQWRDFPEALCAATGLGGLVYERLGHGGSDPVELPRPDDFLAIEAGRRLPALLDLLRVDRPVLLGHSDGGSIALLFAAAFPQRPLACITVAAHVFLEPATEAALAAAAAAYATTDLRPRLERHHGANTDAMFRGWNETWRRLAPRGWSMTDRLKHITCPVLAVQGLDDEHGTPAQVEAIVNGVSGPAETFLIPGCGHVPHVQARDALVARAAAFILRVARPSTSSG